MKTKRPTCSINAKECPLKHLSLDACTKHAIVLPCEGDVVDLEQLRIEIETFRTENGVE